MNGNGSRQFHVVIISVCSLVQSVGDGQWKRKDGYSSSFEHFGSETFLAEE